MNQPRNQNRKRKVIDIDMGRRPTAQPSANGIQEKETVDEVLEAGQQPELFTPHLAWIED